jgi:predicted ester cyclase
MMPETLNASARLLRGFAVDFLTSHDLGAVESIMDPAYRLTIGGHVLDGREKSYRPAIASLFDQFPGLCVTVHDVMLAPDAVALRFTEHGVSAKQPGGAAAWAGVALFRIEDGRLHCGWAEEDYLARKRQLKTGRCDPIGPPHAAPWDARCEAADASTEEAVRRWLSDPAACLAPGPVEEVSAEGPRFAALVSVAAPLHSTLTALVSAGERAAFYLECSGSYAGGFDDIDAALTGAPVILRMAGLATVRHGQVTRAQVVADRLGLHRQLLDAGRSGSRAGADR